MKTTTKKAKLIYKIVKNINPYEDIDIEKNGLIKELKGHSLESNINQLNDYIKENEINLIDDITMLKMYSKLIKNLRSGAYA